MELRQLTTFQKVAELRSFSRAAEMLGYSQSAVTVQIQALEKELNTRLFDRFGKNVSITSAGRQLLKHSESISAQVTQIYKELRDGNRQNHSMHIGTLNSLCTFVLSDMLKRLYRDYPDYHIKITQDSPNALIEMMEHNELDIIYFLDSPRYDTHWKKLPQKREPIVFVCAPDSPLANRTDLPMEEILRVPLFLTEERDNYRYALNQYLAFHGYSLNPSLEVGDTEVLVNMLRSERGISFLPYFAVRDHLEKKELALFELHNFRMNMYHQIVYHKDKWVTDEMLAFIRIAQAMLE